MKLAGHIVRKGLIAKLDGEIPKNGGGTVPVYGRVPDNATYPYIMVVTQSTNEIDQNQSSFTSTVQTRIEVVTRYLSDAGGFAQADQIMNLVLQVIRPRSSGYMDLSGDGFKVYTQTLNGVTHITEPYSDRHYYRTIADLDVRVQQTVQAEGASGLQNDLQFDLQS
jgi:hypothetical protein